MKFSRKSILISLLLFLALPAFSQQWTDYLGNGTQHNVWLWLKNYGAWVDGREANTFYPSIANGNNMESLNLTKKSWGYQAIWFGTSEGTFYYRCRPEGNMLYLTGITEKSPESGGKFRAYSGWIKIVSVKGSMLFTIDNRNTYRYFQATLIQ